MPSPRQRPDFARDHTLAFDYRLFHDVPGAWRSVAHMRVCLANKEWIEHAGFLRWRERLRDQERDKAQRRAAAARPQRRR
jgi:hypothetical protein